MKGRTTITCTTIHKKQHINMAEERFQNEAEFKKDIGAYLLQRGLIDGILPETPDIEDKFTGIAEAYLPDGMREFAAYPTVSLGWMMYIGMAIAKYWDEDWELYNKVENLYTHLINHTDYDHLDDYILEKVLLLNEEDRKRYADFTAECAARTNNRMLHMGIQPGTKEAFATYVGALHQLYTFGAAVQLKALGYRMVKQ